MDQHLYDDQANDDSKQSDGGMREDQLQQEPKPQSKANEGEQGGASSLAQQPAIVLSMFMLSFINPANVLSMFMFSFIEPAVVLSMFMFLFIK
jgi:hypothetical protein